MHAAKRSRWLLRAAVGAGLCAVAGPATLAGPAAAPQTKGRIESTLGDQDFADGQTPIFTRDLLGWSVGEPAPFNGTVYGNDMLPMLGSFEYAHTFNLAGATPESATLTLGLIDIDSPPGSPATVALYFDDIVQPFGAFMGVSDATHPSSAEVVTVPVPTHYLLDGSLRVRVMATRPGPGMWGNAIEADFSRLIVTTTSNVVLPAPAPVPLPAVLLPGTALVMALAGYDTYTRRGRRCSRVAR